MSAQIEPLVTVYIWVWIQYPDGTQLGPFTQSFDVPWGTDIAEVDRIGQDCADSFLERYPLYGLAGEGIPFALWTITAPLMYQYSMGD